MYHAAFIIILLISSCSTKVAKKKELMLEGWKGHTTRELEDHPYFKNLRHEKNKHSDQIETWTYKDQTPYQSGAYCQSLGGCSDMPFYNCNTIFSVKGNVILGADQEGSCPPSKVSEALKK